MSRPQASSEVARALDLTSVKALWGPPHYTEFMLEKHAVLAERAVPRYTSYPTAPHFGSAVGAGTYAAWLEDISITDTLSLYLHIPFCKSLCLYCGCNTKAVRRIEPVDSYVERLIREISLVAERTGRREIIHLHWGGGTPSILGPERLCKLVDHLDARFDLGAMREHAIELDPRYVTQPLARGLASIGVTRASLGVQEFSADVQHAIGRLQPFTVVQEAAAMLRDAGIANINIDLMYGLPSQSVEDVRRSVMLAHALKPQRLAMFGYAHVPWLKPHQKLIDESSLPLPAARLAQERAAYDSLTELGYAPIGLDHYAAHDDSLAIAARAGQLRRNFQGYTTDRADALIGLGTSAIGRTTTGFVQNAPDTGGYTRSIDSGQFATVKGLVLSPDDRLRGRIIDDLMCHLVCDLDVMIDRAGLPRNAFEQEIEALAPFVADGLVKISGGCITVKEIGRPYLRLIAAIFDRYLAGNRARHSIAV